MDKNSRMWNIVIVLLLVFVGGLWYLNSINYNGWWTLPKTAVGLYTNGTITAHALKVGDIQTGVGDPYTIRVLGNHLNIVIGNSTVTLREVNGTIIIEGAKLK